MSSIDDLLPAAADCRRQIAEVQAKKAAEELRKQAAAEAQKKALMKQLEKPTGVSDEQRMQKASSIIRNAVNAGKTEVFIGRFPNDLCTDGGRAINQMEQGWETTLIGLPKEVFSFWERFLKPRGYRIRFQIIDYSSGVPGDIGVTLVWS